MSKIELTTPFFRSSDPHCTFALWDSYSDFCGFRFRYVFRSLLRLILLLLLHAASPFRVGHLRGQTQTRSHDDESRLELEPELVSCLEDV